jgi:hypothetical protein
MREAATLGTSDNGRYPTCRRQRRLAAEVSEALFIGKASLPAVPSLRCDITGHYVTFAHSGAQQALCTQANGRRLPADCPSAPQGAPQYLFPSAAPRTLCAQNTASQKRRAESALRGMRCRRVFSSSYASHTMRSAGHGRAESPLRAKVSGAACFPQLRRPPPPPPHQHALNTSAPPGAAAPTSAQWRSAAARFPHRRRGGDRASRAVPPPLLRRAVDALRALISSHLFNPIRDRSNPRSTSNVLSPSERSRATPQHQPRRFPSPPSPLTLFDRTRLNREKRRTRIAQDARKRVREG